MARRRTGRSRGRVGERYSVRGAVPRAGDATGQRARFTDEIRGELEHEANRNDVVILKTNRCGCRPITSRTPSTDPKTGLLNALTWRSLAQAELERAKREQAQLGILMLDLDHFKMINDGKGHLVGDKVLVAVTEQLRQETRRYDPLGRFGGDEFVLLCLDVDADALVGIAERARVAIERLAIPGSDIEEPMTVSIGAAHFPEVGPELEDLLLASDNALFAAKDRGRNRVVMSSVSSATLKVAHPEPAGP